MFVQEFEEFFEVLLVLLVRFGGNEDIVDIDEGIWKIAEDLVH